MNIIPNVNANMLLFIALRLKYLYLEFTQTELCYCNDVKVIIQDGKSARYKSRGVVYTESLEAGHWKVQSWSLDDKTDLRPWGYLEDASSITVKMNPDLPTPTPLNEGWNWVSGKQSPREREKQFVSVVELANDQQTITVKVKTILDGTPVLTRCLEVTNTSDQIMVLSTLKPWTGTLWEDDGQVYLGYSTRWHVLWEGWFGWREITRGCNIIENQQGLVWDDPFFVLRNINRSEYFIGQLAWPANYRVEIHRDSSISFSAGPISVNELRVHDPLETIISPTVHLGFTHGSFDDSVQAMHQHFRRSVIKNTLLHYVNLYKSFFRPLLSGLKVFHHAPVNESGGVETGDWFAMEITSQDKHQGRAAIIQLHGENPGIYQLIPRGFDPGITYTVTMDNDGAKSQQNGFDLLKNGITVSIPTKPRSELLLFEEEESFE